MWLCKLDSLLKCLYCYRGKETTGLLGMCPEGRVDYIMSVFKCYWAVMFVYF